MPLLQANSLNFQISHRALINDVSLDFQQGEMLVILGPNGAGKTTLMRLLSGYMAPTQGQCRLQNKNLSDYSQTRLSKLRAVMQQHSVLNFPYRAEEVILMGGYNRKSGECAKILPYILTLTDCEQLRDKHYSHLSGGERQRVQLARALLQIWSEDMGGKILFLDEPTSAFDPYHQQQTLRLLNRLSQTQGLTVCCILHDLNLTALYADRVFLLVNGKIMEQGSPQQVLTRQKLVQRYQADLNVCPHPNKDSPLVYFNR